MGQVLVPLLLVAWLIASAWAGDRFACLLQGALRDRAWRMAVEILCFVLLLPLPLADELLAKPRFDALCRARARLDIHIPDALGPQARRMRLLPEPVRGLGLPVEVQPWWVLAGGSGLVAASYETVQARGGWLARWTSGNPEQGPLTFRGFCEPADLEGRLSPRQPQSPHGGSVGSAGSMGSAGAAAPSPAAALRQL